MKEKHEFRHHLSPTYSSGPRSLRVADVGRVATTTRSEHTDNTRVCAHIQPRAFPVEYSTYSLMLLYVHCAASVQTCQLVAALSLRAPSGTLGSRPIGPPPPSPVTVPCHDATPTLFSLPSNRVLFMPPAHDTGDTRNSPAPKPRDVRYAEIGHRALTPDSDRSPLHEASLSEAIR